MTSESQRDSLLFWGCFIALIATAFGFIVRAQIIGEWGEEFALTPTQQGEIFGVGLWPFAISIVVFSLIIDKIGYKVAMIFGFLCHVLSVIITVNAKGYNSLYWGTFIVALGNGTVEAYINPVVATMYSREKTKWLNILHAAWPGGLVLGGVLAVGMGDASWKLKVLLLLIPTVIYFLLLIGKTFPVNERVAAGVSYRDMLREVGGLGIFIISWMIFAELARVFAWSATPLSWGAIVAAVIGLGFGLYVGSLGRPMFVLMLIIMVPLATTELGVDSWVTELMGPAMGKWAPWLLIYTSAIMVVLRFWFAGPDCESADAAGYTGDLCVAGRDWVGSAFQSRRCRDDHHRGDHLRCGQDLLLADNAGRRCGAVSTRWCHDIEWHFWCGHAGRRCAGRDVPGEYSRQYRRCQIVSGGTGNSPGGRHRKAGATRSYQSIDTDKVAELPQ